MQSIDTTVFDVRHESFQNIVVCDAAIEQLATGFGFTEGPVWHAKSNRLIFSDMKHDHMRSWNESEGIKTLRHPSNKANGNTLDTLGRLLSCEHVTSRVVRENTGGKLEVLASHYSGKELNSPNDIIVKSDGSIYFTDPTYGRIREDLGLLRKPELGFQGVYRISAENGELNLLADDFEQPNGLCFSLDEKKLFVNDTVRKQIRCFDVQSDGCVTGGNEWAMTTGDDPGAPDGMKVDSAGNLWCTGPRWDPCI